MKEYKLVGADNKEYLSTEKGTLGGHRKLKIYGRLDCPSALRHIKQGHYVEHRVFFKDEGTAIAAGYRPCSVCMKEHYKLWKEGKLMEQVLKVVPVMDGRSICKVQWTEGVEKTLSAGALGCPSIVEKLQDGVEDYQMAINGDYCVIILSDEKSQWGYTVVWNYVTDKVEHLTYTPYVAAATVCDSQVICMYLIQYWGHPADIWYSKAPLSKVDAEYEPDKILLDIPVDDSVKGLSSCGITAHGDETIFTAGNHEISVTL